MLSNRQQVAHMRHLAVRALDAYPLSDPELKFVTHGENTTFRVDATALDGRDRFLLRVHRPARHGRQVDSVAAIGSELDWLMALRADTDLSVPEPFRTIGGNLTTVAESTDVPEPRVCSMLRWMDGRAHTAALRPARKPTPSSAPTSTKCWETSLTRSTPFSEAEARPPAGLT